DGTVRLSIPVDMQAQSLGAVAAKRYYVRARLAAGQFDAAPVLLGIAINGVVAEQSAPACQQLAIAPGVSPTVAIGPGVTAPLTLAIDDSGTIQQLDVAPVSSSNPPVRVLAYTAATGT